MITCAHGAFLMSQCSTLNWRLLFARVNAVHLRLCRQIQDFDSLQHHGIAVAAGVDWMIADKGDHIAFLKCGFSRSRCVIS